jgi:pyrimidine and pyridine-specific 5'-nucleotidase
VTCGISLSNAISHPEIKVQEVLSGLIDNYFEKHLGLSREQAVLLHQEYYKHYGQAIEGLVRRHQIDPMEYNANVDDALPLENMIKPDPKLRRLLEDIDRDKVRLWLLTNAYKTHGERVVKLLGVDDLFEGLTYCNYAEIPFICKPHIDMFKKAMREAGVQRNGSCYFVGKCCATLLETTTLTSNRRFVQQLRWCTPSWMDRGSPYRRRLANPCDTSVPISNK